MKCTKCGCNVGCSEITFCPNGCGTLGIAQLIDDVRIKFKFRYVGGGYFRDKTVPKGKSAECLHGDEILDRFVEQFKMQTATSQG